MYVDIGEVERPDLTKIDALTDRVREDARNVNRPPSADALGAVQSSLSQRRGKRFGQKAQVRMKTQFLACVLNLSELEYDLGGEKMKTLTDPERPREGRGPTDPDRPREGRGPTDPDRPRKGREPTDPERLREGRGAQCCPSPLPTCGVCQALSWPLILESFAKPSLAPNIVIL